MPQKVLFSETHFLKENPPLFKARTDKLEQDAPATVYVDPNSPTTPTAVPSRVALGKQ